jgi:hypothetical protein
MPVFYFIGSTAIILFIKSYILSLSASSPVPNSPKISLTFSLFSQKPEEPIIMLLISYFLRQKNEA